MKLKASSGGHRPEPVEDDRERDDHIIILFMHDVTEGHVHNTIGVIKAALERSNPSWPIEVRERGLGPASIHLGDM